MASTDTTGSSLRRSIADGVLVVGAVVFLGAPWLVSELSSSAIMLVAGMALIFLSHLIYPFRSQLERFRRDRITDPPHELKVSTHQRPSSTEGGKDAI